MVWANFEKKKILAWETEVEKGVCLRRLAKFIVHSKRFQSSYCAKVVAKTNLKWSGKGEGRRGNACPQTPWSFPSLPSSSLSLITIFCSCPNFLDELTRKRLLSRLKFTTRKFRPGITFAISTNKLYLPKNGCEGPKLGCLIYIQQGLVKKYWMGGRGGGGGASAERGWVMRFWTLCKGWVVQFSATLGVGHLILLHT